MRPHTLAVFFLILFTCNSDALGQSRKQKAPPGGRIGVVVDERLAALRDSPRLNGKLIRRLGRGRLVAIKSLRKTDDAVFLLVNINSRTQGWIQREAVVSPWRLDDAERLFQLIKESAEFDQIVRARLFLDHFPKSTRRAEVLLLLGDAAEVISTKLSRDADRRFENESAAMKKSYYLNYSGLDRYNRQGVSFVFNEESQRLHYDGAAWRELVRRFPRSPQASAAVLRLGLLREFVKVSSRSAPRRQTKTVETSTDFTDFAD
jgi:hypothetical protein